MHSSIVSKEVINPKRYIGITHDREQNTDYKLLLPVVLNFNTANNYITIKCKLTSVSLALTSTTWVRRVVTSFSLPSEHAFRSACMLLVHVHSTERVWLP